MNNPTSILGQAKRRIDAAGKDEGTMRRARDKFRWTNATRRGACVSALVLLFLTVGVEGRLDSDISAADGRVPPTGNIASAATLSPDADGKNKDVEQVTSLARFKAH